ncbi:MAG: DUF3098 domain-containing protein [Bacteroidota bacterium]
MAKSKRKRANQKPARKRGRAAGPVSMPFTAKNYKLLGLSLLVAVIGYTVMRWENEVDGFLSLYIAPLLILAGYLGVFYAVIYREKKEETSES